MTFKTIIQRSNRTTLLVSILAALILCNSAYHHYAVMTDKATQQQTALSQINRWKAEYDALKPYQAMWDKTLLPTSQIYDLYHVYKALNIQHGLQTDQERLLISKIEPVFLSNVPIHASRVCLTTAASTGLVITAPHFSPELLDGLKQLAARRDVEINNITLTTENGVPKAITDFCLIFRT